MESESDSDSCAPPEIGKSAQEIQQGLPPLKSRAKYDFAYNKFMDWCRSNKVKTISENVMITYMEIISKTKKPSTLWTIYSMLRSTLLDRHNIDISKFIKLKSFLKLQSSGYKSKKSKILTVEQINQFLDKAPDDRYLFTKVVLIFGISGGCRRQELKNLQLNNIRDLGDEFLIKLFDTKAKTDRNFIIPGKFYEIIKKYMSTRPTGIPSFFLKYQNGKCTKQAAGLNKIGQQPQIIARYLKLPDASSFTGHCFRRSGAIILAVKNYGEWESTPVRESYSTSTDIVNNLETDQDPLADPSTSSHLYSENDIDTSSVKSENVLDEDDYDSEVVDTKVMLDITDTQILLDDVENLRVEVNPKYPTHKECDLFGEYVAKHLQQLPLEVASELKFRIQTLMTETLLEYIQQHPPEAPPVVKLESPAEEDVPIRTRNIETQTNQTMDDERPQACTAKIPRNTDSPVAKRLKLDNLSSETQISSSKKQPKRTEWTRFAENIALQLEQLPEEVSLQLQSDIYDLISHVLPNPADEDSPNRVKIKDEIIEGTPTEIVDYQS